MRELKPVVQVQKIICLAAEIGSYAAEIEEINKDRGSGSAIVWAEMPDSQQDQLLLRRAKALYKLRRARDRVFDGLNLFADPSWDILLDLFISHMERRKLSTSAACIGASVPPTTALRWLSVLETSKLIEREDDPHDSRRTFVLLTRRAIDLLTIVLGEKFPHPT